jgi:hypothetical protein
MTSRRALPRQPRLFIAALILTATLHGLPCHAQAPPRDNPYDVIGKVFQPFWSVLLAESKSPNKAAELTIEMARVGGRLPKDMEGATLEAAVQFPDKVRLAAPVLGETITVCRNGDEVWATPGAKVEFLLSQFKVKPQPTRKKNTPIYLPITAQQAVFLPALFTIERPEVAEVDVLDGVDHRVITGGLMPELAKSAKAEGFRARIWVAAGYLPSRVEIVQPDFTADVRIRNLRFSPSLPASTWLPPEGVTDIYRTHADMLDAVLFVVMNSLEMDEGDAPWLKVP